MIGLTASIGIEAIGGIAHPGFVVDPVEFLDGCDVIDHRRRGLVIDTVLNEGLASMVFTPVAHEAMPNRVLGVGCSTVTRTCRTISKGV